MATATEISTLRRMIAEPTTATYSDIQLGELIDASADLDAAAQTLWMEKAAVFSALVDTSESGSSRKMGDLHKQALEMAAKFGAKSAGTASALTGMARTRAVERA